MNQHREHSFVRLVRALVAGVLIQSLAFLTGCGSAKHYDGYVEPQGANAQLVMHISGDTYDVFLDGKLLGRIHWTQAYPIAAGHHVLWVKEAPPYLLLPKDAQFPFDIAPGETMHFTVTTHVGAVGWGAGEDSGRYIFIERIQG